jgi:hypothetical protein
MLPHVDRTIRAAAECGVRVFHLGEATRDLRDLLRLESRVLQVRARRRLESDDELGAVILGEEGRSNRANRRDLARQDERHGKSSQHQSNPRANVEPTFRHAEHHDRESDHGRGEASHSAEGQNERREEHS